MKLRGAMIGCGFFAQYHLEAWKRIPEVEIVAACDLEYERARRFADSGYGFVRVEAKEKGVRA